MSRKDTPEQIHNKAATVIAHQLLKVIESDEAKGLAVALTLIASMSAAVIDQADKRPAAWDYLEARIAAARKHGEAISGQLDAGTLDVPGLEKMGKPEGGA
jgi:hypothetical protein